MRQQSISSWKWFEAIWTILQELFVDFCVGVLTGDSARFRHESEDDGVGDHENEERTSDEAGEFADEVDGDIDGERKASEEPRDKNQSNAEFNDPKRLANAG